MLDLQNDYDDRQPVAANKCSHCMGTGWVCERHAAMSWQGPYTCGCGAPGAPCGVCNELKDRGTTVLPGGFKVEYDNDG